jgi:L-ribulokinase
VILERMEENGVPIQRVINGGGIPQKNEVLNRVYANVLGKPVLVPQSEVTSLGSAVFAFLAAGTFKTIEEAQSALCPQYRIVEPDPVAAKTYQELYGHYKKLYFGMGKPDSAPVSFGDVLPALRRIAAQVRGA